MLKAQHPEFEVWNQGIHARAGVACADCHMPYQRGGALEGDRPRVRRPLLNLNRACQPCHSVPEKELEGRVVAIQDRHNALLQRAARRQWIDAIVAARKAGAFDGDIQPAQGSTGRLSGCSTSSRPIGLPRSEAMVQRLV